MHRIEKTSLHSFYFDVVIVAVPLDDNRVCVFVLGVELGKGKHEAVGVVKIAQRSKRVSQ